MTTPTIKITIELPIDQHQETEALAKRWGLTTKVWLELAALQSLPLPDHTYIKLGMACHWLGLTEEEVRRLHQQRVFSWVVGKGFPVIQIQRYAAEMGIALNLEPRASLKQ
jgi:hypothetical protein